MVINVAINGSRKLIISGTTMANEQWLKKRWDV